MSDTPVIHNSKTEPLPPFGSWQGHAVSTARFYCVRDDHYCKPLTKMYPAADGLVCEDHVRFFWGTARRRRLRELVAMSSPQPYKGRPVGLLANRQAVPERAGRDHRDSAPTHRHHAEPDARGADRHARPHRRVVDERGRSLAKANYAPYWTRLKDAVKDEGERGRMERMVSDRMDRWYQCEECRRQFKTVNLELSGRIICWECVPVVVQPVGEWRSQ